MISIVCWDRTATPAWGACLLMKSYRRLILFWVCSRAVSGARAGEFVVQDIQVDGLQRISAGTVFNYLPVQVGSTDFRKGLSGDHPRSVQNRLLHRCESGAKGNVLVVTVTERPAIAEVRITGNKTSAPTISRRH
jgi:outer membrane protein insertion porin family